MSDNPPIEHRSIPTEKVAERWLRSKGVAPEKSEPGIRLPKFGGEKAQVGSSVQEAYDLFAEREELREDIVRRKPDTQGTKSLSLGDKERLIKSGGVGKLIASTSQQPFGEVVARSEARIQEVEHKLGEIFSASGTYESFQKNLSEQVASRRAAREVINLEKLADQMDLSASKVARETQTQHRSPTSVETRLVEENQKLKTIIGQREAELLKNPDVQAQVRLAELKDYKRQLQEDGFAKTPSRQEYADRLVELWGQNKKILITGATGTGKTELVRHAALEMFGEKPLYVTGRRDITPYELLGRTGMKVKKGEGSDIYRPSKLIQSMTANDGKGAPFLYDEIDASPNEVNMAIKTLLNDGPGDEVTIDMDSNERIKIGPNYSFTATANVKSEKHSTRFEVDPAIVRVLEPMILPYMPAGEVYDVALASLMDRRGGVPLSIDDAQTTLKDLCDAGFWIQKAYLGEKVITDAQRGSFVEARGGATTGKPATLKEAVLDPGRLLSMLEGWQSAKLKGQEFRPYLNEQLMRFVNNENFPEDDRYYLIEILALKGFFSGTNVSEFRVSNLDQATLDKWTGYRPEISEESAEKEEAKTPAVYISPDRVARLDPYGRFREKLSQEAEDLLREESVGGSARGKSERIRAIQDITGNISTKDTGKPIHKAYIDKLGQIASDATVDENENLEAIELLEDYFKKGAFKEKDSSSSVNVDYYNPLTDQALDKASAARILKIRNSDDISQIKKFAGDLTKEGSRKVHSTFINKIHTIADVYSATDDQIKTSIRILEEYARNGFFNTKSGSTSPGDPDRLTTLREQATNLASKLRTKLLAKI